MEHTCSFCDPENATLPCVSESIPIRLLSSCTRARCQPRWSAAVASIQSGRNAWRDFGAWLTLVKSKVDERRSCIHNEDKVLTRSLCAAVLQPAVAGPLGVCAFRADQETQQMLTAQMTVHVRVRLSPKHATLQRTGGRRVGATAGPRRTVGLRQCRRSTDIIMKPPCDAKVQRTTGLC